MDLAAAGFFRDAVMRKDRPLALGGRAAMASHSGNDVGRAADFFQFFDERAQNQDNIVNLPAGRRQTDSASGADAFERTLPFERVAHGLRGILNVRIVHVIGDPIEIRKRNVL